ncbi:hypothetical protein Tco_0559563 [Tanacetum coccineum]
MTGNNSFLIDYQEVDGGFVAFGGSPKGGIQMSKDAFTDDAGKNTNEEPANECERNGQEKDGGASNKEDDQNVQYFRVTLDNLLVQQKNGYANSLTVIVLLVHLIVLLGKVLLNADDL